MTDALPPVPLMRDGRYLRVWLIGWFTGVVRWLELLAYGVYAYEITGSPVLVALVALIRFLPLALLGVIIGAVSDQINPRRLLVLSLVAISLTMAGMLALERAGILAYWHLIVATLVAGVFWASEMTLRRKLIGEIAGPGRLAQAMSFDYATSNGTRMLGPLAGGLLFEAIGMSGVFAGALALYLISIALVFGIATPAAEATGGFRPRAALAAAGDAMRRALKDNDVTCILAVTVIFNIWGFPYVSMIPVIGEEVFGLSPSAVGYVAAIEGAMGLMLAVIIGLVASERFYRRIYYLGCTGVLGAVALIGWAEDLTTLCIGLALAGLSTACFATMQSTLIYWVAPPEMRGRYLGLVSICIGAGLIGFANVGITAELFGAARALQIIAMEGLVAILALAFWWRAFGQEAGLRARPEPLD